MESIDYKVVVEIIEDFLNNEKVEILGISVGEERQVREAIKNLLTAYEKEKEENMSYYYHIQGLEDDIRMHYISTYKIEKEIKIIKDSNTYGYVGEEWNDRDVVELLENLISKEE